MQPDFFIFISISVASTKYKAFGVPTLKFPLKSVAYILFELLMINCVRALLPKIAI